MLLDTMRMGNAPPAAASKIIAIQLYYSFRVVPARSGSPIDPTKLIRVLSQMGGELASEISLGDLVPGEILEAGKIYYRKVRLPQAESAFECVGRKSAFVSEQTKHPCFL